MNTITDPKQVQEKVLLTHKNIWWRYHKQHPEVYERFKQIAFDLIYHGHTQYSSDAILHIIRFELNRTRPKKSDQYLINNNHSAYYSRLFGVDYPDHKSFFEKRELISEKK